MTNIIVFSDGTSNSKSTQTNVYQFYTALKAHPDNQCFYDPGVGSFTIDVLGKAFGAGMAINIRQCYNFIAKHYKEGDRIFLFGFSRGAYTVRSLANFIDMVGLVEKNNKVLGGNGPRKNNKPTITVQERDTQRAYDVYRCNKTPGFAPALKALQEKQTQIPATVYGLGVWDTVGALGLPNLKRDRDAFGEHYYHETVVPAGTELAYHALSIDDQRREFAPVLFNRTPKNSEQREEMWFVGMHSDVGGGYKISKSDPQAKLLSNIALHWMKDKFSVALDFAEGNFEPGDPLGPMHDSMTGAAEKIFTKRIRTLPKNSLLHSSVLDRLDCQELPVPSPTREPEGRYQPTALNAAGFKVAFDEARPFNLTARYALG